MDCHIFLQAACTHFWACTFQSLLGDAVVHSVAGLVHLSRNGTDIALLTRRYPVLCT